MSHTEVNVAAYKIQILHEIKDRDQYTRNKLSNLKLHAAEDDLFLW
jgi:hypothetical protein